MADLFPFPPGWWRAATLRERAASLPPMPPPLDEAGARRAAQQADRWHGQAPFEDETLFELRLDADGLDVPTFHYLLGEPEESLAERLPAVPPWLLTLYAAYTTPAPPDAFAWGSAPEQRFQALAEPLIHRAIAQVQAALRAPLAAHAHPPVDAARLPPLLATLLPPLLPTVLARTLVLELDVARLQGLVEGEDDAERLDRFIERLRDTTNALALLTEYPVLARQLVSLLERWAAGWGLFLERLLVDWPAIQRQLAPEVPGPLVAVEYGEAGALLLTFESGWKLRYLSRSLAVEAHFQALLHWLNQRGADPPLQPHRLLAREGYGWAEVIPPAECLDQGAARRFYRRQGSYLALLYALCATDYPPASLVAAGEHPHLSDLSALFQPVIRFLHAPAAVGESILRDSVVAVGLLRPAGVERRRAPHAPQPRLAGVELPPAAFVDELVQGFRTLYELLVTQREALLAEDGPLAPFATAPVTVTLRPHAHYEALLRDSFHPDLMRDAIQRDRLFDRLWQGVAVAARPQGTAAIIRMEQAALRRGEWPHFTAYPASRDLWGRDDEPVRGFFEEAAWERVRHRLAQMGPTDLARQEWLLRALAVAETGTTLLPHYAPPPDPPPVTEGHLLALASRVGDRLAAQRLSEGHEVTWLALQARDQQTWHITRLGADLYGGLPGVALFLAYLGVVTGEPRHTTLAQSVWESLRHQLAQPPEVVTGVGAMRGWGGILYALTHLAALWQEPRLLDEAHGWLPTLAPLIATSEVAGLAEGLAGTLAALLVLHQAAPHPETRRLAVACGERLLAIAFPMPSGIGWPVPGISEVPLAGMAHGAAGIAAPLLELAALTGSASIRAGALEALAYERSLFLSSLSNWADLRPGAEPLLGEGGPPPVAWCHGAAGIGLARLWARAHHDTPQAEAEIAAAIQATRAHGVGHNHSLCHGDLGNLNFLFEASRQLADAFLAEEVGQRLVQVVAGIEAEGWLCGVPLGLETPGLMAGLAGIGYQLLRFARPESVPDLLRLAPPCRPLATS